MPPTNLRIAQEHLDGALLNLEVAGAAAGWPTGLRDAHYGVASALDALARADLRDFEAWLREEHCQHLRGASRCHERADVVIDERGWCARHYPECAECGCRLVGTESITCRACDASEAQRARDLAERDAGYRVDSGAASDRESNQ